ncbi:C4-dicarboxylate ABC transporter, partial [Streptomyces sp. NPDC058953]
PYLLVVRHRPAPGSASPVWLLPLVAPMVAAAFGPLLAASADGETRRTLLVVSLGLAGASGLAALAVLPLVLSRLIHHGPLPLALTPSLFLVLGPLGQSTTAAGQLADALPGRPWADLVAVGYGVPVMGFALLWLALAGAMVVRAARRGLPFTLGWWAFTFPVGTCVTGAAGLAQRTGLTLLWAVAAGLYALLLAAWAVAGLRTVRGLVSGALPAAPPSTPGVPSPATARTR